MAEEMFDGFPHEQYATEVTERWGAGAFASSDAWWRAKSATERAAFTDAQTRIAAEFGAAASAGLAPGSDEVQAIVLRHVAWLSEVPGTPGYPNGPDPDYVAGLGEMYASDPRFATVYAAHGPATVELVRDALAEYAGRIRQ